MIVNFIIAALSFAILYIANKFIIRPYRRMRSYAAVKGASILPFVPVAGIIKLTQDAYNKYGD